MFDQGRAEQIGGSLGGGKVAATVTPPPLHYNPYPPPLAKYEDVAANPKLFLSTLEKLHAAMGTKFMIPIIGGRDLDLHKLFLEVTSRGGVEKILREKRWKEVTATFNFPSTATNASFVLRKYYYSLLHHYEQIYFFKAQGWTPLPHGALQSGHAVPIAVHGAVRTVPLLSPVVAVQPQVPQGVRVSEPIAPVAPPPSPLGTQVTGVIDGKFESGYLVTVTLGSQKLKGVLYQTGPAPNPTQQLEPPRTAGLNLNHTGTDAATSVVAPPFKRRRRRRKKCELKKRDPAHPKPNRSGYNFFFSEQHARLKPLYRGRDREISRIIGELWNNLKENEKAVYQEKAADDKQRYIKEMESYRERLQAGQVISHAVPIQQMLPGADADMDANKDEPGMESSEMFDDDEDDDDEDDDDFCSMSGSEDSGLDKGEGPMAVEAPQGAGTLTEPANVVDPKPAEEAAALVSLSGESGGQGRGEDHRMDVTPNEQQEKSSGL